MNLPARNPRCACATQPCDCCIGPRVVTPLSIANRPWLSAIQYRAGTYAAFFETMQARVASADYPELARLTTREKSDPAIALLDAWAILGDVLTFYQERIANEGYLRTALERRSILELARLVGYALRPGVASTVYLAYTIEQGSVPVTIPVGTRSNSIPGPGEQMQAFETADPVEARFDWNTLPPRMTQPQTPDSILSNGLFLKGANLRLNPEDPLLVDLGEGLKLMRVARVDVDTANDRTTVWLRTPTSAAATAGLSTPQVANEIQAFADRYRAVESFAVAPNAAMTRRVLEIIERITSLAGGEPDAVAAHLQTVALPALEQEFRSAVQNNYTNLAPWIREQISELRALNARLGGGSGSGGAPPTAAEAAAIEKRNPLVAITGGLRVPPSLTPAGAQQLPRDIKQTFAAEADATPRLLVALQPAFTDGLYVAWRNIPPRRSTGIIVYALRVSAAPFGHNSPLRFNGYKDHNFPDMEEWKITDPWNTDPWKTPAQPPPPQPIGVIAVAAAEPAEPVVTPEHHEEKKLYLDNKYDIAPDSYVVIERPNQLPTIIKPSGYSIVQRSLAAYGLSGQTTLVNLVDPWIKDLTKEPFTTVRTTRVYAHSERLDLAEAPVTDDIKGADIELGELYRDLQPGRWLIVTGDRTDVLDSSRKPIAGIKAAELVMLAGVRQSVAKIPNDGDLPGDRIHTFIHIANSAPVPDGSGNVPGLAYSYKRDTVTIYGNVIRATNGETRQETLGNGDASQSMQLFKLSQAPLTYVSAPTISGISSTLRVRVNDVLWHEVDSLAGLGPNDRVYITRTDDNAKTSVIFGTGTSGARPPTGQHNLTAVYRQQIGAAGNVKAQQISLIATRPLGAKTVINPMPATGGADAETRDQARGNVPMAVMALDRLVSVQDYADFSRTFAGVGKTAAVELSDGFRRLVQVTIAGAGDIPISTTSDLYRNLVAALHLYGDPFLPIRVDVRDRLAIVISAKVLMAPDYSWDLQEPKIRAKLLDAFSFEKRDLGQDALLAAATAVIQQAPGVAYVKVDAFTAISESAATASFTQQQAAQLQRDDRITVSPARVDNQHRILPAQIAYLMPDVPDTLILQELKA